MGFRCLCAIGLVIDGELVDSAYTLVKPNHRMM